MRKTLACLLAVLCLVLGGSAVAEYLSFANIYAGCTIPDSYIILTPDNLAQHPEWMEKHNTTEEAMLADWEARGVYVQAWSKEDDVCIEINAVQDDRALQYYDVDQQSVENRKVFRLSHTNGAYYKQDGYTYEAAEWVNNKKSGRFLSLKYKRSTLSATYRGLQRRTIRNGYTITIDYQVHDRSLKAADTTAIDKLLNSWSFEQILDKPANAVSKVVFLNEPPAETNTGKFVISGTGDAGLHLQGVAMRMSSSDKVPLETTINKNGKFSMDVQLPAEGVWLVTMTVDNEGAVSEELVFNVTTYQKTLLIVNLDEKLPEKLTSDKLVISGTTLPNTTVECIVGTSYQKQVKVNNTGAFKFTIDTANEGDYEIVLTFQKKNYDSRRYYSVANRRLTQQDIMDHARSEAVKPNYATLVEKLKNYTGRTLTYNLYLTDISRSGDEWVLTMAMTKSKNEYKNLVIVTCSEEPTFEIGSQRQLYGTCMGTYMVQNGEEGTKYYPCIELLFWDK